VFLWRVASAILVVLILLGVLLWRYYYLQVSKHEDFQTRADSNRLLVRPIPPPRGLIYDRNGLLLADNQPIFNLSVVKERVGDLDAVIEQMRGLITITDQDLEKFQKLLAQRQRPYEPVVLKFNLTEEELGILAVNEYRFPGVRVAAESLRYYPYADHLAHVVGYVGRINPQELQRLDPARYAGTPVIGKIGLERFYEDRLLGQPGYETVEVNARGQVMKVVDRVPPTPGEDLRLDLDIRLQQLANEQLSGERGAVVMIDVKNGGVLAMASAPAYDPNLFVTGISHKDYLALSTSHSRPLYDRALRGLYPPGSTVKPVYALAFLSEGVASSSDRVFDPGFFQLQKGGRKFRDWKKGGHGWMNVHDAIVRSCDIYFYDFGVKAGIDILSKYGEMFGLGSKTGIDIPSESRGVLPSKDWKYGAKGESWYPGDTVNTSIGQGYTLTTPLQLAVMASRLAARAPVTPHLLSKNAEEVAPMPLFNIAEAHWNAVSAAMEDVVHSPRGTAQGINRGLEYRMAGKTGTAQVVSIRQDDEYDESELDKLHWDHALFVAYAPADNPRVAIGLIVENGQHGSSTAAPIARKMFDAYLSYYPAEESAESATAVVPGMNQSP
ncbi:MAG: penicillin-binding protein 2, partial [bacterium]